MARHSQQKSLKRGFGNKTYIPIHGRLDRVTVYSSQEQPQELLEAPWEDVEHLKIEAEDHIRLKYALLEREF